MLESTSPVPARRSEWRVLGLLLPYLWEYRWRVAVALAFLVAAKLANVAVPLVLKEVVDGLDPALAVEGVVLGPEGQPIAGAQVFVGPLPRPWERDAARCMRSILRRFVSAAWLTRHGGMPSVASKVTAAPPLP